MSKKIYVQISDTETFGQAVAEAMSCEIPVIISGRGFLPQLVNDDQLVVDHNSPSSLANKIIKLLSLSDNELSLIGQKLRKRIINKFSYDIRKKKISNIITQLMNKY